MRCSLAAELGAFACGGGVGWLLRAALPLLRPVRVRCAWCGKVRVSLKGQACPECISSVLNGPRAAPNDWPEA